MSPGRIISYKNPSSALPLCLFICLPSACAGAGNSSGHPALKGAGFELGNSLGMTRWWHQSRRTKGRAACSSIHPPSAGWENCFASREVEYMHVSSQGCLSPLLCSALMVGDTCGWDKLYLCCPRDIVVTVCRELHSTPISKIQKIQSGFAANSSGTRDTAGNEGCTSWCF